MYGDEMRDFVKHVEKVATEIVKKDGDHVPMVFGKVGDSIHQYTIVPNESIGAIIQHVTRHLAMIGAEWVVVVGSFYMRTFENKEKAIEFLKNYRYGSLATDPKSVEVLVISGFSLDGEKEIVVYRVDKEKEGYKVVKDDLLKFAEVYTRFNPFGE